MLDSDIAAAETWARRVASRLPVQHIRRHGSPYLDRYTVAHVPRGPSIYLHRFRASDPSTQVHTHPWDWSCSLVLSGGYREDRCLPTGARESRTYLPGTVNVLRAADQHRIDLLQRECWTLFLAGAYQQPWAFHAHCP